MPELKWTKDIFSTEPAVHDIWNNWEKATNRSDQELLEIVCGQFQEEYQKRALFLLLVPDTTVTPFRWTNRYPYHYLNTELDFRKVETGLRAHAVYWLTKFIDYARYEPSLRDQRMVLLDAYNKYILQLLAVLPAEDNQAETLFPYFSINDSMPWVNSEDSSGYNPMYNLWTNPSINERWKKAADQEMRQIIKSELQEKSFPRAPHENALKCYVRHLQFILDEKRDLPYGKELFVDQIKFLISLEVSDQNLFKPWKIALILNILAGEEYLDLRHKFIRFVLLRDGNFSIFSEQTAEAAQMILIKCEGQDGQVERLVQDQLSVYRQAQQKLEEKTENEKRAKEVLLAPMRKPAEILPNQNEQSEQ